jgi:hypothetical protein
MKYYILLVLLLLIPAASFAEVNVSGLPVNQWVIIESNRDGIASARCEFATHAGSASVHIQQATPIQIPQGSNYMTLMVRSGPGQITAATSVASVSSAVDKKLGAVFEVVILPKLAEVRAGFGNPSFRDVLGDTGNTASGVINYATTGTEYMPPVYTLERANNADTAVWASLPPITKYGVYNIPIGEGQWFTLRQNIPANSNNGPNTAIVQFSRR